MFRKQEDRVIKDVRDGSRKIENTLKESNIEQKNMAINSPYTIILNYRNPLKGEELLTLLS